MLNATDLSDRHQRAGCRFGSSCRTGYFIALAARSLAHASKNDKQKAKVDIQKAIGAEPKNPYVKWLRASLTASQGDFATAKKELGNLVSIQEHETAAGDRSTVSRRSQELAR